MEHHLFWIPSKLSVANKMLVFAQKSSDLLVLVKTLARKTDAIMLEARAANGKNKSEEKKRRVYVES